MQAVEQEDKLRWAQTSHVMALIYNVNRGKGKPRTWEDFNPYAISRRRQAPPAEITPKIHDLFQRIQDTLNDGTK